MNDGGVGGGGRQDGDCGGSVVAGEVPHLLSRVVYRSAFVIGLGEGCSVVKVSERIPPDADDHFNREYELY